MDERSARARGEPDRNQTLSSSADSSDAEQNGRRGAGVREGGDERAASEKPALTEREQQERWPLG